MKVTAWVNASDLVTVQKSFLEKIIQIVLKEEKSKMFGTIPHRIIFPSLKKAGVDGIELLIQINTTDKNIKAIQRIIKKYDMPVYSIHQSFNSFITIQFSEIQRLCEIAHIFSAKVVVLHANALGKRLFDTAFINSLKELQHKYHIIFGIENLPKSFFSIWHSYTWNGEIFRKTLKDAGLGITFDTTHLAQVGEDISAFYKKNKKTIVDIHLSDFKKNWLNSKLLLQQGTHLPLGKGELPLEKFITLVKQSNYDGLVTLEIDSDLDGLCQSAQMIKQ